jgi:hypothetical protein
MTVQRVFARLRAKLAWVARGGHAAPRIHDLRHTFICNRIKLWQRDSADIDHAMIALVRGAFGGLANLLVPNGGTRFDDRDH